MKQLLKTIGAILFYIFILAVAGWTASLTLAEVRVILPNDPITPYFALALFDGGALTWLLVFLGHAKGLAQRAIAIMLLVLDLAGVVVLSAGRLLMGGQALADIPQQLGATMVYALIGATIINLIAIYAFHIADPETMQQIEIQTLDDTIQAEALSQARANIENEVKELASILAARATGRLKYALRLPMNSSETSEVMNDERKPAPLVITAEKRKPVPLGARLLFGLRNKFARKRGPVATYEQNIPAILETQPATGTPFQEPSQTTSEQIPESLRGQPG